MPTLGPWHNILPFAPAVYGLMNTSYALKGTAPCEAGELRQEFRVYTSLCEFVAILAIAWTAASVAREHSASVAVVVSCLFIIFAIALPRLGLHTLVRSMCQKCSGNGKFAVGLVALVLVAILNYVLCSAVLM